MSRNTWSVKVQDSGDVWSDYATIPRPNDVLSIGTMSTLISNQLIDGSLGFVLPETKYNYDNLQFVWYADTGGTIKSQIEGYVKAGTRFKIVDHNSTEYIGRFISVNAAWLTGISDEFDIVSIFTRDSD